MAIGSDVFTHSANFGYHGNHFGGKIIRLTGNSDKIAYSYKIKKVPWFELMCNLVWYGIRTSFRLAFHTSRHNFDFMSVDPQIQQNLWKWMVSMVTKWGKLLKNRL